MFTINIVQTFSNENVHIREKWISKTLVLAVKFPGRCRLE